MDTRIESKGKRKRDTIASTVTTPQERPAERKDAEPIKIEITEFSNPKEMVKYLSSFTFDSMVMKDGRFLAINKNKELWVIDPDFKKGHAVSLGGDHIGSIMTLGNVIIIRSYSDRVILLDASNFKYLSHQTFSDGDQLQIYTALPVSDSQFFCIRILPNFDRVVDLYDISQGKLNRIATFNPTLKIKSDIYYAHALALSSKNEVLVSLKEHFTPSHDLCRTHITRWINNKGKWTCLDEPFSIAGTYHKTTFPSFTQILPDRDAAIAVANRNGVHFQNTRNQAKNGFQKEGARSKAYLLGEYILVMTKIDGCLNLINRNTLEHSYLNIPVDVIQFEVTKDNSLYVVTPDGVCNIDRKKGLPPELAAFSDIYQLLKTGKELSSSMLASYSHAVSKYPTPASRPVLLAIGSSAYISRSIAEAMAPKSASAVQDKKEVELREVKKEKEFKVKPDQETVKAMSLRLYTPAELTMKLGVLLGDKFRQGNPEAKNPQSEEAKREIDQYAKDPVAYAKNAKNAFQNLITALGKDAEEALNKVKDSKEETAMAFTTRPTKR